MLQLHFVVVALATLICSNVLASIPPPPSTETKKAIIFHERQPLAPIKTYECYNHRCQPLPIGNDTGIGLSVCRLICDPYGSLWPRPTGKLILGTEATPIEVQKISFKSQNKEVGEDTAEIPNLQKKIQDLFIQNLNKWFKDHVAIPGQAVEISILITDPDQDMVTLNTDESYILTTNCTDMNTVQVTVSAGTLFGLRHALETLAQLMVFDDASYRVRLLCDTQIIDRPRFAYRGISLDTGRQFYSLKSMYRVLDSMAMNKLNRLHWHISDYQSFPFEMRSAPNLTFYGAYSPTKVYFQADVYELIEYAKIRGISIVPEVDTPAHVGPGWQWDSSLLIGATDTCYGPPCGHLSPINPKVFDILQRVFSELLHIFRPDIIHLGADEVDFSIWNQSESVREWMLARNWTLKDNDFYKLWSHYQHELLRRLKKAIEITGTKSMPILWSSSLTNNHADLLKPKQNKYVVEAWDHDNFTNILENLIVNGFYTIVANSNAWYLDCGFGAWYDTGNSWCDPYKTWQVMYDNRPWAKNITSSVRRPIITAILGGEASIWSAVINENTVEEKLWPRTAAMAERLWTDPPHNWQYAADRMQAHAERMSDRGIRVDAINPYWCYLNEGHCYQQHYKPNKAQKSNLNSDNKC